MNVIKYDSQCKPQLNTQIMRSIEAHVCRHRNLLPNGWRCIIEFQNTEDSTPYYMLDIQSNQGGGEYAPVKMAMLKQLPDRAATGGHTPTTFIHLISKHMPSNVATPIIDKLMHMKRLSELDDEYWEIISHYGLTHWHGGIRIPYDILVTEDDDALPASGSQCVNHTKGEIRIAFSGAKEWEDTFFAFCIFRDLQNTLDQFLDQYQIWYNLRSLKADPHLEVWLDLLDIREA